MNAVTLFEKYKNQLVAKSSKNQEIADIRVQILDLISKIEYELLANQKIEIVRKQCAILFDCVKNAINVISSVTEVDLWQKNDRYKTKSRIKNNLATLIAAILSITFSVLAGYFAFQSNDYKLLIILSLDLVSVMLFFSFNFVKNKRNKANHQAVDFKPVILVNTDKLIVILGEIMRVIDKRIEELELLQLNTIKQANGEMDDTIYEIFQQLFEAKRMNDSELALETIKAVQFYLHNNEIKCVEYSPEKDRYFEILPSKEKSRTIVPAFVKGDHVIKKGRATKQIV